MKNGKPTIVEMDTNEFITIKDNPRQRDTARHAKAAKRKHLSAYSPTHRCVAVATIGGVPVCKEDGHTRSFLWESGDLEKPDTVLVTCYPVHSMDEAAELYTHFDSQSAVEGSGDRMFGAARECNISLSSCLLNKFDFVTALRVAHFFRTSIGRTAESEYSLMRKWAKCILIVDSWNLSKNRFKGSGLLAFALIAVASRDYSDGICESFFKTFDSDSGKKDGKKRDGVQALSEHMVDRRLNNQMTGAENILGQIEKAYSCLKAWSEGLMINNVQPSTEAMIKLHAKARKNIDSGAFEV